MPNTRNCYGIFSFLFFLISFGMNAQSTAEFEVDNVAGCEPLTTTFKDLSTSSGGLINSWVWEVNGTDFSTVQDPTYLLNTPGKYTICLTVVNEAGQSDKSCKTDYIEVYASPEASFHTDATEGCGPLEINFTSTSTSSNGQIQSWVWDLGGPCGVLPQTNADKVSCIYNLPDTYQPTLIVTDNKGCKGAVTKNDLITVFPNPEIQVSSNYTFQCDPPFSVLYTNDSPEANTTYSWDFGNGQTFSGTNPPAIIYNENGPYTLTVNAINQQTGCAKTLVLEDVVQAGFEVDFSFNSNGGCGDLNINFLDESLDGASNISWDFGDGNTSTFSNPSYSYTAPGCYDVSLTREINGCSNTLTKLLCIVDPTDLDVSMEVDNKIGCDVPHVSTFKGISPIAETWLWDFGDGTTSTLQNPDHTYTGFGVFPVSLTIEDAFGCTKEIRTDTVVLQKMVLDIAGLPLLGCLPLSYTLTDSVQSVAPIVSWDWEVIDINDVVIFSSSLEQPTSILTQDGCFRIKLEVENSLGCRESKTFQGGICGGNMPAVDFSATPLQACADQAINFEDLSGPTTNSWAWDFDGDGDFDSFESDPTFQYRDTGCFTVTLVVGSNGCFNTLTLQDYVCIFPPVARNKVNKKCETPFVRTFINRSIGADSIHWDFGVAASDADTSSLFNPSFTFPSKDTFVVTQVVYNFASGCTDTLKKKIIITELNADFSLSTDTGCAPMELEVTNNSTDANRYQWISSNAIIPNPKALIPNVTLPTGSHDLRLIVRDVNNCRDTMDYGPILSNAITLDFNSTQLTQCLPVDVRFEDNSTNLYATNTAWDWTFGASTDILGTSTGEDIVFTFDQAGFIPAQLTVTDSWGCVDSLFVNEGININAPFSKFTADSFSCPGYELQFENLSGGTGLSYLWDFGDGTTSMLEDPSHEFSTGTYQVALTITTSNCNHVSTHEVLVESVDASFAIDPDYAACPPTTVNFVNQSMNAYDFEWTFGDNSGSSDQASHIYVEKGIFDVTLIAIGRNEACRDTISLDSIVSILGPSGDFFFEVNNRCLPAEVTFYGSSDRPFNYTWFPDDGNSILNANTSADTLHYFYNEVPGNGFVPKLLVGSTCDTLLVSSDTIFVSDLEIDFMASDTFLCDGETMVGFESLVETNENAFQVNWSFEGASPSQSNIADVATDYQQPGVFDVTLMVDNGECLDTLTKEAYIEVVEAVSISAEDQSICFGDTVMLEAISNATEYLWTPMGAINDPTDPNPLVNPSQTIDYLVTGTYKSCEEATDSVRVEVMSLPEVIYSPVRRFFPGQSILLDISPRDSNSDYAYEWSPSTGLSCSSCANPTASLDTNMVYTITITNRETGCSREVNMAVSELTTCPEDLIYMPTVFSPDGDGINDDFLMLSSNVTEIDYFRIYDRWGALLWETQDLSQGWDGRVNGELVNTGVYVYSLEAPCPLNNSTILKKGGVTVLR